MGKQQRAIPHGRYRLLDDKRTVRTEKLCAIYIEYSWNSTSIRRTTGYCCKVSDWNQKGNSGRGEFRSSYGSEYKRINNVMKAQLNKMDIELAEYSQNHSGQMSSEIIKGIRDGKPLTRKDEGRDFIEFTNALAEAEYKRNVIGISRKKNFTSCMRMFSEFLASTGKGTYKKDSIYLGEITPELVDSYIDKLNASVPFVETLVGAPTDPTAVEISLNGNGWTWIGYPAQATNTLDAAFASANPQEGDMVKNQSSFSIYTEGEWMGTLTAMVPGDGYMYNNTAAAKTFHFPKPAVSGHKKRSASR